MKAQKIKRLVNRARVLFYLSQFLTIPEIANKVSTSRRAVYSLKSRLERDGLINADRELTKAGALLLKSLPMGLRNVHNSQCSLNLVRLHNAVAKLEIIEKPLRWENYLERVEKRGFRDFKRWRLCSGSVIASFFLKEGIRVRLTPNFVFLSVGAVWEGNAGAAAAEFERRVFSVLPLVERELGLRVVRGGEARFAVSRREFAFVGSFAEVLAAKGWKINVYSEDGSEKRFVLDKSLGVAEIEAVSKRFGLEDSQAFEDLLFDACVSRYSLRGLNERIRVLEAARPGVVEGRVERREVS